MFVDCPILSRHLARKRKYINIHFLKERKIQKKILFRQNHWENICSLWRRKDGDQ